MVRMLRCPARREWGYWVARQGDPGWEDVLFFSPSWALLVATAASSGPLLLEETHASFGLCCWSPGVHSAFFPDRYRGCGCPWARRLFRLEG